MYKNIIKTSKFIFAVALLSTVAIAIINPNFLQALAQNAPKIGADNPPNKIPDIINQFNNAIIDASESVIPSVVSIAVESESNNQMSDMFREFHQFFGEMPENSKKTVQGFGSGVIISADGYIVTNNHVVENAIKNGIKVTLSDKSEYKAEIIGTDPSTDLAIIKIDAKDLKPAYLGNMSHVKPGNFVIAVGNPLGLDFTVTQGIVSAIGRGQLGLPRKSNFAIENFIQTDAAINPGNSGGGLFDLSGALIGINAAIATETGTFMGYGFAIPIDIVTTVIDDLIEDGKIDRPSLGVMIANVDEITSKSLGLPKVKGVLVNDIVEDSGAKEAGIQPEDVILSVDGVDVNSVSELQTQIIKKRIGKEVKLSIWRDKKEITKNVKLKARQSDVSDNSDIMKEDDESVIEKDGILNFQKLGFSVKALTSDQKEDYSVKDGVYIYSVIPNSPISQRGMSVGGVIVSADMKKVNKPSELSKIIKSKSAGDAISFKIKYKDNWRIVSVEIPE